MNILVVVTPSHRPLYEEFFLPTLPADARAVTHEFEAPGDGIFHSASWEATILDKLRWVLAYAEGAPGEIFGVSDVDVQFFPPFSATALRGELETSGADVLFQQERRRPPTLEVNAGFYVARSTPYLRGLLREALRRCETADYQCDQLAINSLLDPADHGRRWGHLPPRYYARSQGFPPPRELVLHHANASYTPAQKVTQLRRVRRFIAGGPFGRWSATAAEARDYAAAGYLLGMLRRRLAHPGGLTAPVR